MTIQNILLIADFIFWGVFFFRLLRQKIKILQFLFILCLTITILLRFINGFDKAGFEIYAITNFGKALFCLFYYIELFKTKPKLILKNEPAFWIVSGLFFYSCVSLPFYAIYEFIHARFPISISKNLFSLTNIAIILMHILFIKAYLCQIRQHKAL